jgi:Ca2+-binding RTX toxin-like protein
MFSILKGHCSEKRGEGELKSMMTTIGRMSLMVAFALLLMATALASVAYAAVEVGTQGGDNLTGTSEDDTIYGLGGADTIEGRPGDDALYGGDGRDTIRGQSGQDYVNGGRGRDTLHGGSANDVIEAADGEEDVVNCGRGNNDRASVDEQDQLSNCEIVNGQPA